MREGDACAFPSLSNPLSVPRPHPRRCHGFPLLSGSGAELLALLRSRCRLLPARSRGVDVRREGRGTGSSRAERDQDPPASPRSSP